MRTDELITVLTRDATVARMTSARAAAIMVPAAALIAAASFLAAFPVRPGLPGPAAAAVAMKLAVTLTLAASGLAAAMAMARPAPPRPARLAALALAPLLVATLLAFDLATHGLADWRARLLGHAPLACVALVALLSTPPLAALILALRRGAPVASTAAGMCAGLAAAGLGASVYALHCPDDSPLFLAAWYGMAALLMAMGGAACGRWLRW